MPFVLDAPIAACWAFEDENHPIATLAMTRIAAEPATAPSLFWFEVRNVLVVNERRGRLTEIETARFLGFLAELPLNLDQLPNEATVLQLARTHNITVYDAAYLELALRESAPLATLDRALAEAAKAEGIPLVGG